MSKIRTFKDWSGFLLWILGIKFNFIKPCWIFVEKISFKSCWEDMLNFLKPFFHLAITLFLLESSTYNDTGILFPIFESWIGREGSRKTWWCFVHPTTKKYKKIKTIPIDEIGVWSILAFWVNGNSLICKSLILN